jgi:hypothetical protein
MPPSTAGFTGILQNRLFIAEPDLKRAGGVCESFRMGIGAIAGPQDRGGLG